MRKLRSVVLILVVVFRLPTLRAADSEYFLLWQKEKPNITDLALIYQGGTQRPQWTKERFAPYVSYRDPKNSKEKWLFDGFLFIEFQDGKRNSYQPHPTMPAARKEHWQALMDKNFAANDGVPSLEQLCRQTAVRIGEPSRRRQVVLTLPVPISGQTNWGKIGDHTLDFRKPADRLIAIEWYLDEALRKWDELSPKQLDLAGFYWVHEGVARTNDFLPLVAKLVHDRHQQFFWIPYWQPGRLKHDWRSEGFDVAWQQPNHFFHPEVPDSRLEDACRHAKEKGMGMEMEFDGRMISDSKNFERRFDAYLDAYEKLGVKSTASIAYYEGGGALFQLARSQNPGMRAHYDRIARFIVDRQAASDSKAASAAVIK